MKFQVIIQPPARQDIEAAYLYLRDRAPRAADRWLAGIERAISSLAQMPRRCGLARESVEFDEEIRQLLYGKRANKYRVLFVVRQNVVRVLHVRHGARDSLTREEMGL